MQLCAVGSLNWDLTGEGREREEGKKFMLIKAPYQALHLLSLNSHDNSAKEADYPYFFKKCQLALTLM